MKIVSERVHVMDAEPHTLAQWTVATILGIAGLAYGVQKLVKNWKATGAESSVISIMHDEIERMASQNATLAKELNKLQLEIIKLTKELHILSMENQRLNTEIAALTKEVTRLQGILKQSNGLQ